MNRWLYSMALMISLLAVGLSWPLSTIYREEQNPWLPYVGIGVVVQFTLLDFGMLLAYRSGPNSDRIYDHRFLFAVAILLRCLLLFGIEPYTSNDVDRYLFDGEVVLSGFDPYVVAHDATELMELKEIWKPPEEHAQYPTLYPPLALALFSFCALFGPDGAEHCWRCLLFIGSSLSLTLGANLLQRMGRLRAFPLIGLSPLLILESGVGLHVDTFCVLALCGVFWAQHKGQMGRMGLWVAIGALLKLFPLALTLPLIFSMRTVKDSFYFLLYVGAGLSMGYGLMLLLGYRPIGSLGDFFELWRFGSPLFTFLETHLPHDWLQPFLFVLFFGGCSGIAFGAWRWKENFMIHGLQWSLALPLMLGPVVFPWYLMPLAFLLAFSPNLWLMVWTIMVPLTYEVLGPFHAEDTWEPSTWPLLLIGLGWLLAGIGTLLDKGKQHLGQRV